MKVAPLHFIIVHEHPEAAPGVYIHALETAAWLRDNDLDEAAESLEHFGGEAAETT